MWSIWSVAAAAVVIVGTVQGFIYGWYWDQAAGNIASLDSITPNEFVFATLGALIGLIAAAVVLGLSAAVFVIQRRLAANYPLDRMVPIAPSGGHRREPHVVSSEALR